MKHTMNLSIICLLGTFAFCQAQTTETETAIKKGVTKDTVKPMNLLDEQTKMYGSIFSLAGVSDADNPTGGATNYQAMLETEASEELKEQLRELYDLYDTSLDPAKKQELQVKLIAMLEKAKAKSLSDQ